MNHEHVFAPEPVFMSHRTFGTFKSAEFPDRSVQLSPDTERGLIVIREFKRFIENVDTNGMHRMGMVLRCWEWTGCSDQKGRPRFYHNDTGELAKRALIEILIEQELPDDCCVKSICGNKLCVRPEAPVPGAMTWTRWHWDLGVTLPLVQQSS